MNPRIEHQSQSFRQPARATDFTHLTRSRLKRLDIAFSTAIIGLLLIPIVLNVYSMITLVTIKPKDLSEDNRNRYIFTWFLNVGAVTLQVMLLSSIWPT